MYRRRAKSIHQDMQHLCDPDKTLAAHDHAWGNTSVISAPVDVNPVLHDEFVKKIEDSRLRESFVGLDNEDMMDKSPTTANTVAGLAFQSRCVSPSSSQYSRASSPVHQHGMQKPSAAAVVSTKQKTTKNLMVVTDAAMTRHGHHGLVNGMPSPRSPAPFRGDPLLYSPIGPPPRHAPPSAPLGRESPLASAYRPNTASSNHSTSLPRPGFAVLPPTPRSCAVPEEYRQSPTLPNASLPSRQPSPALSQSNSLSSASWRGGSSSPDYSILRSNSGKSSHELGVSVGDPSVLVLGKSPGSHDSNWI